MADPFLGEIRPFGCNFAPRGWAMCEGQILPIQQNSALFSLLGTSYGGNGTSTYALPDLRGSVAIHQGQGPGLSSYTIGEQGGTETVTINTSDMPVHAHLMQVYASSANTNDPTQGYYAIPLAERHSQNLYGDSVNDTMGTTLASTADSNQPHNNMEPFMAINYCIALQGIFPSRS